MTGPRLRQRRRHHNSTGVEFLVILVIAILSLVWLEDMEMRRFHEAFYYVQQTTKGIGAMMDIPPGSYSLPLNQTTPPGGVIQQSPQRLKLNATEAMINDVVQYESSSICPELLAAATMVANASASSSTTPKYNILMMQLVGVWRLGNARLIKDGTPQVRQQVYESNAKLLQQHGIDSMPLTRRPTTTSGMLTPNFWKMEAVMDACSNGESRDLVWFLDSDIVLTGDSVPIDILWTYHAEYTRRSGTELSILFAKDWKGVYSGSFVVNCKSPSAMQFLQKWKEIAVQKFQTVFTIPKHSAFREEDAVHEVKALRELMKTTAPSAGVRTTVSPCALATFEIMFHCGAKKDREVYLIEGPVWYEPGSWAVHISGYCKDRVRRNEYLLQYMPDNTTNVTTTAPRSLVESARFYLAIHQDKPSIDPAEQLSMKWCNKRERAARKAAKERMVAMRGP